MFDQQSQNSQATIEFKNSQNSEWAHQPNSNQIKQLEMSYSFQQNQSIKQWKDIQQHK